MIAPHQSEAFLSRLDVLLADAADPAAACVQALAKSFPHYRWVGIYWLKGDMLILGPFVGDETEHRRIRVGEGVCGTAVAAGKNQVISDVRDVHNYLACSVRTRSEIVVLLRRSGQIVGQIDADGHEIGAFDASDESLLSGVGERLMARIGYIQESGIEQS
jgi:GAF domain-containing protein